MRQFMGNRFVAVRRNAIMSAECQSGFWRWELSHYKERENGHYISQKKNIGNIRGTS